MRATVPKARAASPTRPSRRALVGYYLGALGASVLVIGLYLALDWTKAEMLLAGVATLILYTAVGLPLLLSRPHS